MSQDFLTSVVEVKLLFTEALNDVNFEITISKLLEVILIIAV